MSIRSILADRGVLTHVVLPPEIDILLSILNPVVPPPPPNAEGIIAGDIKLDFDQSKSPIPGFDFHLALPTDLVESAPYKVKLEPAAAPTSFKFWLVMAKQGQAYLGFKFIERIPGLGLKGAKIVTDTLGNVGLESTGVAPILVSRSTEAGSQLGPALLVSGSATKPASIRITPDTDSTEGIVTFGLEPPAVVFGNSNIGFHCPSIVIDDSETAKGPGGGAPGIDPPKPQIDPDELPWRGLFARQMEFYLPKDLPFFSGHPIKGYFAIPRGEGGVNLTVETKVPPRPTVGAQSARPGYSIRIECIDPTAKGLSGLVPTLITARMDLPLDGAQASPRGHGPITFMAGKPVRLTMTLARDPVNDPGSMRVAIGLSSQGPNGLLSVRTDENASTLSPPKIFNTAAAMATALIADEEVASEAGGGFVLAALAAAGTALSALFKPESQFVLNGAEIESTGHGLPVGGKVTLSLDYTVAARVVALKVPGGALSVEMNKDQPMRIRVRRVRMSVDPSKSGLEMIDLDYDRAEMEVENPGAWDIEGIKQLFDVVGSRSGRGSSWIEVDLRFKLNLGPIRVSGLTIRGTLKSAVPEVTVTGIEAEINIPGAIQGRGALHLIPGGFQARLGASVIPLRLAADAFVIYTTRMTVLKLGVDLPAPLPLANSGLGLLGISGLFGIAARPSYGNNPEADPVLRQLQWKPEDIGSFTEAPGQFTFGLDAAVGTLPDFGFTFSAKAGILITVPDVAVRGALNGRIMRPAAKMSDPSYPPVKGISFIGFLGVDSNAVSFAVIGSVDLRPLLVIRVPVAGHYPFKPGDDWYTYLGADGHPSQGRAIGPISAKVLPGILDAGADAYLMVRGRGIQSWPYGRPLKGGPINLTDGFVIAFGFSLQTQFGVKPIAWAELYASLDLLIGAKPRTLGGFGRAGGSLNLGPFSIGVQADISFLSQNDAHYLWAQVTGKIELLFFDVEGTVTISFGTKEAPVLPPPDQHPLDRFAELDIGGGQLEARRVGSTPVLTDDSYRVLGYLAESPGDITDERTVWPDAMIVLPFAIPPEINMASAGAQFPGILGPGATPVPKRIGSEMLRYTWRLDRVSLVDVTDEADKTNGPGQIVAAELSSRWQVPRGTDGDVSELLLFSTCGDLWVNRRSDAGTELPSDPLGANADICNRRPEATPGWAIGHMASKVKDGYHLPPDPISLNPMVSRLDAYMHHFGVPMEGQAFPLDNVCTLPPPYSIQPARIDTFADELEVGLDRKFYGDIVAPNLTWLAGRSLGEMLETGRFVEQRLHLDLDEAITEGVLVLLGNRRIFESDERFDRIVVRDAMAPWVGPQLIELLDDGVAAIYRQQIGNPIDRVIITWQVGRAIGIVGLRGMTVHAAETVAAELKGIQNLVSILDNAKQAGPKVKLTLSKHERAILRPGRLYRLEVDMVWSGELFETGKTKPIKTASAVDTYAPKGGGNNNTKRKLFFGTAKKAAPVQIKPASGHPHFVDYLFRRQDVFEPEMIGRYLAGYEPAQSEAYRFCDDPIRSHFSQSHVAALAGAYGFKITTAIRRTDRPGNEHALPSIISPLWSFATEPKYLGTADQIRYKNALVSNCSLPLPGATATVDDPKLEPEAWYEVYVLAKSDEFADGKLPGVSFRTSRWRKPEGMFAGLGLKVTSPTAPEPDQVMIGDLAIAGTVLPGGAVIEDDDYAYQNGLNALGLEGWPVTIAPRLSRMWVADGTGGWMYAGLMIESPEPLHRPGRLLLGPQSLSLEMGVAGASIGFGIHRRDRSGSRLIYLTATPFQVASPPAVAKLVLSAMSKRGSGPPFPITGKLTLPVAPAFAEDP